MKNNVFELNIEDNESIEENFEKDENVLLVTKKKEIIALGKINFSSKIILKNSKMRHLKGI